MDTRKVYDYYAFGWTYKQLYDGLPGSTVGEVLSRVDAFLQFLIDNKCDVALQAVRDRMNGVRTRLAAQPPSQTISAADSSSLADLIHSVDRTVVAELELHEAHVLTEKRLGLTNLTETPGKLFGDGVFDLLPKMAKYDFTEAGMCIAFERGTAAAFHILRGTEGTLRYYYASIVKRNRVDPLLWHPMIEHLQKRRKTPKTLLDSLDNIRENFRNPTSHPETTYTVDEVQDLFAVCADAVNRMIRDIEKKGRKRR